MRRIVTVAIIVILTAGGYQLTQIDWAVFDNHAEVPDVAETIDSSLVTLRSLQLGDSMALEETPSFGWSQFVDVRIEAECNLDRLRTSASPRRAGEQKNNSGILGASVGLEIVRRSSLGDGSVVVYSVLSGARIDQDCKMTWSNKTWIPHVRGDYRVRVILQRTSERDSNGARRIFEPVVIGAFTLHVVPGESSRVASVDATGGEAVRSRAEIALRGSHLN